MIDANIPCAEQRCSNIRVENITVQVPSGEPPVYECKNVEEGLLQINCTDPAVERETGQG